MTYKITKKNIKDQSQKSLTINFRVKDFCCVGEDLFFIHDNGIGLMVNDEFNLDWYLNLSYIERPDLSNLSSICYNKDKNNLYIVSDSGSQVNMINLDLLNFEELISKDSAKVFKNKFIGNIFSETYVVSEKDKVVWSIKDCHRCFTFKGDNAVPLVGCGKSGLSISSLTNMRISKPTGVTIMGESVCFADSGNNCLRGISGNSTFNIIDDCCGLKDIFFINDIFFFLNENIIYMLSSKGDATHLFELYKAKENIFSFCITNKGHIYILEENDVFSTKETKINKPT